jgi:DNA-directed RNA polymerase subunit L
MELEILKNQQNHAEFVIKGERHTLPSLLKNSLLKDNSVVFAAYKLKHPLDDNAVFVVKTKGKTAKKALQDACSEIDSEFEELRKAIKKALK